MTGLVCLWTLGILSTLVSLSHARALFHTFDTGETLKTFDVHPEAGNGVTSFVDATGRTVWRRHVTYEWHSGSWARVPPQSLPATARNYGYNRAKAGNEKKAQQHAAEKMAAARAAKALAQRREIEARQARIDAAKIAFARHLSQIGDERKRREALERAKRRLAAVKAARKAAHAAQKRAAERARAIQARRIAAAKAAEKRSYEKKEEAKKPTAKAVPVKKTKKAYKAVARAVPHKRKGAGPLPRTCYCRKGPPGRGKCYYFVKRTSKIRYCSVRRCAEKYVCVGSRKAATMLCMFRKVTNRVVPDGYGTCKDVKVDRHMYVPYSVLSPAAAK